MTFVWTWSDVLLLVVVVFLTVMIAGFYIADVVKRLVGGKRKKGRRDPPFR